MRKQMADITSPAMSTCEIDEWYVQLGETTSRHSHANDIF